MTIADLALAEILYIFLISFLAAGIIMSCWVCCAYTKNGAAPDSLDEHVERDMRLQARWDARERGDN